MTKSYAVIIDTDEYAGNFEREMCAYCTGEVGECGVGSENQIEFHKDFGVENPDDTIFSDAVWHKGDEHGCFRPAEVVRSPGGDHNSVAIYFLEKPTQKMIDIIKERSVKFADSQREGIREGIVGKRYTMTILGFRLETETTTVERENI